MERFSQKEDASVSKAMKVLKMKDSKVGTVILKDNVFENSKLGNKLGLISHIQSKEHRRITWEKEQLLSKQRNRKLCKSYSSSFLDVKPADECMFPPIQQSGRVSVVGNCQCAKIATSDTKKKQTHQSQLLHDEDQYSKFCNNETRTGLSETSTRNALNFSRSNPELNSRGPSERALKHWKRAVHKALKQQAHSPGSSLPALLSPMLLKRVQHVDGTKDPRFAQLVDQLVPNKGRGKSLKYTSEDLLDEEGHDTRDTKAFREDRRPINESLFKLAQQAQLYKADFSHEKKS